MLRLYFLYSVFLVTASVLGYGLNNLESTLKNKSVKSQAKQNNGSGILRLSDPCRHDVGRAGGTYPNKIPKLINQISHLADTFMDNNTTTSTKEINRLRNVCAESLQKNKDKRMTVKICALALARYRKRQKERKGLGRENEKSPWEELYADLGEILSGDEIIDALDLYGESSLGIVIDNTGSMSDNIEEVIALIDKFIDKTEEDVINFVILLYGDPNIGKPMSFNYAEEAKEFLRNYAVASMGGDCPELTCGAIEEMVTFSDFMYDSPIFVFTDANSKDCNENLVDDLISVGVDNYYRYNFVVTDFCGDKLDGNYSILAQETGGNVYVVDEGDIREMQDIVRYHMRGGTVLKKQSSPKIASPGRYSEQRSVEINVDETVGKLDVDVVFGNANELHLLSEVTLKPKYKCEHTAERQRFGNTVYFKVDCPCIGVWELRFPAGVENWEFTAKTHGDHSIDFDIVFERPSPNNNFREFTKQPCATEKTKAWVTVYQHESLKEKNRVYLHISIDNQKYDGTAYALVQDEYNPGMFYAKNVTIPEVEFMPAILGKTSLGTRFMRYQRNNIKPPSTCLNIAQVSSHYTIRADEETVVVMNILNRHTPNTYDIYCKARNKGFTATVIFPASNVLEVSRVNVEYYFYVKIRAPSNPTPGTTVQISCYAISKINWEKVQRSLALMVTSY